MAFRRDNKIKSNFSKITIGLASPDEIIEKSSGEVLKPETINYRTYKPERDGLFCEKIFGPVKDYECHCGKYKRIRYKGIVCDRCGVEVTEKKVRRERMGHIELVVPVAHIWYFRSLPNKIGYLLGLASKKLDSIIYYEKYVVVNPGAVNKYFDELSGGEGDGQYVPESVASLLPLKEKDLLTEEEYLDLIDALPESMLMTEEDWRDYKLDPASPRFADKFIALMGAEAVYYLLRKLSDPVPVEGAEADDAEADPDAPRKSVKTGLEKLAADLREQADAEGSQQRKTEALKRLQVVNSFISSKGRNRPEWMILKAVPVIPPELRPLVPLDGGRFATSDLNDLYRRVIIRNNRLKRLIEINAPEVILRNEKRLLQEAVDSLLDNSRKASAVKSDAARPLKSLSDSLKGKQGRFRQNLLGKRVDYSARSVIVVGPELKMHECGIPKLMAAELYKPFIIRKLIERGIVKTVKSAKKIVDRKEAVVWDILEHVMKGHPVLLNRAPTLHRLGIQAFQPRMIEGKAIQLHPLACTAFNADFDGDQMAVHLPLGNEAILEAQMLMLGAHNILNPANGAPITVPSQDMVLGLYYITKLRPGDMGEGSVFYGPEEAQIAYNEGKVTLHAPVSILVDDIDAEGKPVRHIVKNTSVGRVLFNEYVPKEVGYLNEIISKKSLRKIIGKVIKTCGVTRSAQFLDDIKNLGYKMAFRGGLSFNLGDVIIPPEKAQYVAEGQAKVDEVLNNFAMGMIGQTERYNQIIDIWTNVNKQLADTLMKEMEEDQKGFNSVYMMLDSGARGSKDQIRQLSGMRGLMAKPQKSGAEGGQIIENPILANFKEGLSVLEYFISTHGARKGLADTALKTADAGYLTRRLVDVAHDVIINEEDCGTLRGLVCTEIRNKDEIIASLSDRILGRVSVDDINDPATGELIVGAGEEITEAVAEKIEKAGIKRVEIRSVLTCESKHGVCAKCYGRNLSTHRMVQKGEAVGVIAAQSIGEPGTQLTLRTFHVGGVASNQAVDKDIVARHPGKLEIDDLRTITNEKGETIVVGRMGELRILEPKSGMILTTASIPYGAKLYFNDGDSVEEGDVICEWDPFNNVIIIEEEGRVLFENVEDGVTINEEVDSMTGKIFRTVTESKDRNKAPAILIFEPGVEPLQDSKGEWEKGHEPIRTYTLPVGGVLQVDNHAEVHPGDQLIKMPRTVGGAGDITGGLPRVTELFEARNPSNPAVVSEIDGTVSFGKTRRGNREIIVASNSGEERKYMVPLTKELLVQEKDYIRAGTPLSSGAITPTDILNIMGPTAVQEYIVNQVQDVYRTQGVNINDKHFEVIVRQMMRKVVILDPGDSRFLEAQVVDRRDFMEENDRLWGKKFIEDKGQSKNYFNGEIITQRKLRDENSMLKRRDEQEMKVRDARPATSEQILQGITRAALQTSSFISAASFQETTKVLNEAAINGKTDTLEGMKENVICGHLIPAGTGLREYNRIVVANKDELAALQLTDDPEKIIEVEAEELPTGAPAK